MAPRATVTDASPMRPIAASVQATQHQIAKVLNHHTFAKSRGPARLLAYLGERLVGRGGCPASQLELARVLGLPPDFDPARNPLVRIHVSKLRRMLDTYAQHHGGDDPVILRIPRNSYRLEAVCSGGQRRKDADQSASSAPCHDAAAQRNVLLVTEFAALGDEAGADSFTHLLALALVPLFVDCPAYAAIGPVLRSRLRADEATPASFAVRHGVGLVLDGEVSSGHRGLQASVRVVHAPSGDICWTDWIDAPFDLASDQLEAGAERLAIRIAERVESSVEAASAARGA